MLTHAMVLYGIDILLFVLLIVGLILIFKSKIRKKRLCSVLLAILLFILFILSSLLPIEEPFLTFPTAEEALHYKYDYDIELTVEGNESTQIVCHSSTEKGYYGAVLPKTDKGWKPEIQWDKKIVGQIFAPSCIVMLQRYKQTDDFYLTIQSASGMDELFDNRNTEFQSLTGPSPLEKKVLPGYYYAFIDGIDENYVLTIDGEDYTFPKAK